MSHLETTEPLRHRLKNRKQISHAVTNELAEQFNQLHLQTGLNKSKLLDQALSLLLDEHQADANYVQTLQQVAMVRGVSLSDLKQDVARDLRIRYLDQTKKQTH